MTSGTDQLEQGCIVWALVSPARGTAKVRPVVIVTQTHEIKPDAPIVAVAITTTFNNVPTDDVIPLPWHPTGNVVTRLRRRSAAVCSWQTLIAHDQIERVAGQVPPRVLAAILQRISRTSNG